MQQRRDEDEVGERSLPLSGRTPTSSPDAVHLAPVPHTEVEPPVERHDGSDLSGGCRDKRGKVRNIILDSLVVDVLTGYDHFQDLDVFEVQSKAMTCRTESSQILCARTHRTANKMYGLPVMHGRLKLAPTAAKTS